MLSKDEIESIRKQYAGLYEGDTDFHELADQALLALYFAERERELTSLCATVYQVVGAADGPVEVLDNLLDAAYGRPLRHSTLAGLPWTPKGEK